MRVWSASFSRSKSPPKSPAAPSTRDLFQVRTWLGWTSTGGQSPPWSPHLSGLLGHLGLECWAVLLTTLLHLLLLHVSSVILGAGPDLKHLSEIWGPSHLEPTIKSAIRKEMQGMS